MKMLCQCGATIVDQTDDLPYKASLERDQDSEPMWTAVVSEIAALVEQKDDLAAWASEHHHCDDISERSVHDLIYQVIFGHTLRIRTDVYECESCGRLFVFGGRRPNIATCFTPESGRYEGVLRGHTNNP